ncbi:MAG TPA: neuraminidase-like domain-containing protein, partial [Nitrospira sp.]|nr:neuraminidase-like domain-containing protein [Nitrospira sp.]
MVRTKASLLFDQANVEKILGLLEGTAVYTTNAPANLTITIPDALGKKLKYSNQKDAVPPRATIQVTGILTDTEKAQAIALSNDPEWAKAITRIGKQALNVFNDVLFGIFPDLNAAKTTLLAGDVNVPPDPQNPSLPDTNTAPGKRFYFLQAFLPFLRQRLAHRFIIDTMASAAGLTSEVTDPLLSDILLVGSPLQAAIKSLEQIKYKPSTGGAGWKGYLIPPVEDAYIFIATSDTPPAALVLDGQSVPFPHQQDDPSNVWSTDPVKLKSGVLYEMEVSGQSADGLEWKTATSPRAPIPSSALLPDYSAQGTTERDVFLKLSKAAILVNGFNLSVDEVSYWQSHATDFDGFDLNHVSLQHWLRLQAYTDLRKTLPKAGGTLLDLFKWACQPDDPAKLSERIAATTLWKKENINKLLAPNHFNLNDPQAFRNEVNLVRLRKALQIADKIGVDIDRLFEWAKPIPDFGVLHKIAEDIRKTIRARFDQEDWEQVVKPLNDQLREDQKQALIHYLLVQPDLVEWGVVDADSLFEFFLIDVQMGACMQTSRIKQAISTVQLFVQRCLLGLEEPNVPNDALDRDRWEWMQKYRVWEANRKVFLYPENWIDPQLRDDKSPFYKELESELLQKDINTQTVEDALKSYLFKVDEVANLKIVGLFVEQQFDDQGQPVKDEAGNPVYIKLHVFSRTRNAPYFFYYRYFDITENNWYAWEKVQVDIPSYDVENDKGEVIDSGAYVVPIVWNNRLLIFFPQFMKKTQPVQITTKPVPPPPVPERNLTTKELGDLSPEMSKTSEFWEIKIGWSEYRNGKWLQKQVSKDIIYDFDAIETVSTTNNVSTIVRRRGLPPINNYQFVQRLITSSNLVTIELYRDGKSKGSFQFIGSQVNIGAIVAPTLSSSATSFH